MIYKGNRAWYLNPGQFENIKISNMEKLKMALKELSKEQQRQISGGWNSYCDNNLQGNDSVVCKTDNRCDLDIPICEAI